MKKSQIIRTVMMAAMAALIAAPAFAGLKIQSVTGDVSFKSSPSAEWRKAAAGQALEKSAAVRTGAGSSCIIKTSSGNMVKVSALTTMSVGEAESGANGKEKTRVDLTSGRLIASVNKIPNTKSSFQIKTPTAVAGVRGTDLFGDVDDSGKSSFGVTDGQISVTVGDNEIIVSDDLMMTVGANGEVTEPAPIPEELKQEIIQETQELEKAADQEEKEAVKEEKKEDKEAAKEESKEAKEEAKEESGGAAQEETTADEDTASAIDNATESIEAAMDTEVINNMVEEAADQVITGDVTVDIYIGDR